MEANANPTLESVDSKDLYEYLQSSCYVSNGLNTPMQNSGSNLKPFCKWMTEPIAVIPANSVKLLAFSSQGRNLNPHGTTGDVEYQFNNIYGGTITLKVTWNVPAVGANTATANISSSSPLNGSQGNYTCTVSYTGGWKQSIYVNVYFAQPNQGTSNDV